LQVVRESPRPRLSWRRLCADWSAIGVLASHSLAALKAPDRDRCRRCRGGRRRRPSCRPQPRDVPDVEAEQEVEVARSSGLRECAEAIRTLLCSRAAGRLLRGCVRGQGSGPVGLASGTGEYSFYRTSRSGSSPARIRGTDDHLCNTGDLRGAPPAMRPWSSRPTVAGLLGTGASSRGLPAEADRRAAAAKAGGMTFDDGFAGVEHALLRSEVPAARHVFRRADAHRRRSVGALVRSRRRRRSPPSPGTALEMQAWASTQSIAATDLPDSATTHVDDSGAESCSRAVGGSVTQLAYPRGPARCAGTTSRGEGRHSHAHTPRGDRTARSVRT
jgi:hypothetical protein